MNTHGDAPTPNDQKGDAGSKEPSTPADPSIAPHTQPQFSNEELRVIGVALVVVAAVVSIPLFVGWPSGTPGVHTVEVATSAGTTFSSYALLDGMSRVVALVGIGLVAAGIWLHAVSMRVWVPPERADGVGDRRGRRPSIAPVPVREIVSSIGASLRGLSGATGLVFSGLVLMLMAGYMATVSVPDLTGAELQPSDSTMVPGEDASPATTQAPAPGAPTTN